jgi:3-dehydroquinate dehydratase-1
MVWEVDKPDNLAEQGASRARKFPHKMPPPGGVVAAVHTLAGLRLATRLHPDDVDVVEIRADALAAELPAVERAMKAISLPILLTVRHPAEGGVGALTVSERRALYHRLLPRAALVDLEVRSLKILGDILTQARALKVRTVISTHFFRTTPSLAKMLNLQRQAFRGGADIFKLATLAPTASALARLLEFTEGKAPGPRAVMGMGSFGQVSRLALARAGSVLNYGYLDQPNAPGQWEARELKRLMVKIMGPPAP